MEKSERLFDDEIEKKCSDDNETMKLLHKTIKKVGEDIENFLLSFFHSKGVPSHRRSRIGGFSHHPTVKVGEPVLYQGKVIALVKQIPFTFRRGIFGGISESPFAIIHF